MLVTLEKELIDFTIVRILKCIQAKAAVHRVTTISTVDNIASVPCS